MSDNLHIASRRENKAQITFSQVEMQVCMEVAEKINAYVSLSQQINMLAKASEYMDSCKHVSYDK
jgi:outer membrane protein TolC